MAFYLKQAVSRLVIAMLLFVCFAEALEANSASSSYMRRKKRFFGCPTLQLICPTQKQYFSVHSKWEWRHFGCKLQESVLNKALKECDIGPMEQCKEKWVKKQQLQCSSGHLKANNRSRVSPCLHFARPLLFIVECYTR